MTEPEIPVPALGARVCLVPERRPEKAQADQVRRALDALRALDGETPFEECFDGVRRFELVSAPGVRITVETKLAAATRDYPEEEWITDITVKITAEGRVSTVRFHPPHMPPIPVILSERDDRLVSDVHVSARAFGRSFAFPDVETSVLMGCPLIEPPEISLSEHPVTSALCELLFYQTALIGGSAAMDEIHFIDPMGLGGPSIDREDAFRDEADIPFEEATAAIRAHHPTFLLARLEDNFGTLVVRASPMKDYMLENIPPVDAMTAMRHVAFLKRLENAMHPDPEGPVS